VMTHPASATSALPCVDIHCDDLILAGALPALVAGAHETSAHVADAAILGLAPARPPLSDEEDEEAPQDAADDDEDEDDEDEDEDDEDEDDADEDEDEDKDGDDDEEDDEEEDEDEDDDDDDDDEEEEKD
jgi:hypothetical protein